MTAGLKELMASPDLYPLRMNLDQHSIAFVPVSPKVYQRSAFLPSEIRQGDRAIVLNLDDLLLYHSTVRPRVCAAYYILHGAFCCSTLLCRYLEAMAGCFVLKEPMLLSQLAFSWWQRQSSRTLALSLTLLTRAYGSNDRVFIKTSDLCNVMADALLGHDVRSKALFLLAPLRVFLLSALKSDWRRAWLRGRFDCVKKSAAVFAGFAEVGTTGLLDAQKAAYLWLFSNTVREHLWAANPTRVLPLDGDLLANDPGQALQVVAEFLGLPVEKNQIEQTLTHPSLQRHSKNSSQSYNSNSRRDELADLEDRFGREADQGMEWAIKTGGWSLSESMLVSRVA